MAIFAEDPLRIPDFIGAGPDAPCDEATRGGTSPKIRDELTAPKTAESERKIRV
jgi:hypothetical protein